VTFITTIAAGIDMGILVGIVFSLAVLVWHDCHPHTAELGYVADENNFRDVGRFPQAVVFPHTLVFRIDSSLYFTNMGFVEDRLREALREHEGLEWVVVDFSGVNDIDAVALGMLDELMSSYSQRGIKFALCGFKGAVRDLATREGWAEDSPTRRQYRSVHQALREIGLLEARR
jgi:SulP family sulfate permease